MKDIFIESQGKDFVNSLSPEDLTGLYLEIQSYKDMYMQGLAQAAEFSLARGTGLDFQPDKFAVVRESKFKIIGEPKDFEGLHDYISQRLTFFNTPSLITEKVRSLEESIRREIIGCVPSFKKTLESVYEILDRNPLWIETEDEILEIREERNNDKKKPLVNKRINYTARNVLRWESEYGTMSAHFNVGFSVKKKNLVIYHCGTAEFDEKDEEEKTIKYVQESFEAIADRRDLSDRLAYLHGIRKVLTIPDLIIKKFENHAEFLKEDIS